MSIVAHGRTKKFRITKFHKEHDCNLSKLNKDYKECGKFFHCKSNQIKDIVITNVDSITNMIITYIQKGFGVVVSCKKAHLA